MEPRDAQTTYDAFVAAAKRWPDHPFIHIPAQATTGYADGPIDWTYGAGLAEVERLRACYAAGGYGLGQRVGLALDNRADCFFHWFAWNSLGVGIVPLSANLSPDELGYLIQHSDIALIVSLPEHLAAIAAAQTAVGSQVPVVTAAQLGQLPKALTAAAPGQPTAATESVMLYTSGTTGKPKGCILSNEYVTEMGRWYLNMGGYCPIDEGRERLITPLPLNHMNALVASSMVMIMAGGCIVQLDRFHPSTWWQSVRESRATILHYLGVVPAMLLNAAETEDDKAFGQQIKFGFGAGCDPRHQQRFEERFGIALIEGWAMTETGAGACITAHEEPRHLGNRCFGKAPDYLEYRIVDEEGRDVAIGQPGEFLVRQKGDDPRRFFFTEYYKNPQATAEAWAGGYFHTGDVVRVDAEGSFFFVDRSKNIVRRSGENIAAVEVEGVVFQHPDVASVAILPVPDEIRGEEVMAMIIAKPGIATDEAAAVDIMRFCLDRLAYYKAPGYVAFLDKLPMTGSQKLQRGEIKKLGAAMVEAGQCFDLRALKKRPKAAGHG